MKTIMARVMVLLVGCLLLLPGRMPAPIFGVFGGFDRMTERAQCVLMIHVVEAIDDGTTSAMLGLHAPYRVEVISVVKGPLPEWARQAPLPMGIQAETADPHIIEMSIRPLLMTEPLMAAERPMARSYLWMVFCQEGGPSAQPHFVSLNEENAVLPLHPETRHVCYPSMDPLERVEAVIHESIRLSEEDAQRLKNILAKDAENRQGD